MMSADSPKQRPPSRRTFIGWSIGMLLTAIVATVVAPIAVYIFPAQGRLGKRKIRVALPSAIAELKEGVAIRFDAPAGMAFVMADGGEQNAAGDPTFGGFLTRDQGTVSYTHLTLPTICSV